MSNEGGQGFVLSWVADGAAAERELSGARVLIGRAKGCDLCFPYNAEISRLHASLTATPQGWQIEDVTSRAGTFVNGERIFEARLLKDGDQIGIGELLLSLRQRKHGMDTVDVGAGISVEEIERRAAEIASPAAAPDTSHLADTVDPAPVNTNDIPGVNDGRPFTNFYELIGVEDFSHNSTLIHDRAKQRLRELRAQQEAQPGQNLRGQIESVSEAMIWLTNHTKKRHYDEQLAQRLGLDVQLVGQRVVPVQRPEGWQIGLTIAIVVLIVGSVAWFGIPWLLKMLSGVSEQLPQATIFGL